MEKSSTLSFPEYGAFQRVDLPVDMWEKIESCAKKKGITRQEAIDQLFDAGVEKLKHS
jgi:macrodomain Ter protein organizer (MatP/YcbG family)